MTVAQLRKHVDRRFSRLNRRMSTQFKVVDTRFIGVDARIQSLESTMEHRFAVLMRDMNRGFEALAAKIDSLQPSTDRRLKLLETAVDVHENRFKDMDRAAPG